MPAILLLLCLAAAPQGDDIARQLGLDGSAAFSRYWDLTTKTLCWLFGAAVLNQLLRWLLWDTIVARALGTAVPGVLKELSAVLVYVLALACVVGLVFDRSVTAFLAALGAGGLVVGLALRELLADVFTGLAINIDRTFVIGDWVMISEGGGEPTVAQIREIGWRCTILTTEEQTSVVLPNGTLGRERVTNISQPIAPTRFESTLTVEFSVPMTRVKRVLLAAIRSLEDTPGFDSTHAPAVLIKDTSSQGVEYLVRYWILPWHPVSPTMARDQVLSAILRHLHTAGIALAYPKTDIYHAYMPRRQVEGHSFEDEIKLLSNVRLFQPLTVDEITQVAESLQRRKIDAEHILVRSGDRGDSLFILIEGLLEVLLEKDGRMIPMAKIEPGQVFGEMSLMTGEPRSATIRSITDCVVYEISRQPIERIMQQRPELALSLSRILAERQSLTRQALEHHEPVPDAEAFDSFARQILGKMRDFLIAGRAEKSASSQSAMVP